MPGKGMVTSAAKPTMISWRLGRMRTRIFRYCAKPRPSTKNSRQPHLPPPQNRAKSHSHFFSVTSPATEFCGRFSQLVFDDRLPAVKWPLTGTCNLPWQMNMNDPTVDTESPLVGRLFRGSTPDKSRNRTGALVPKFHTYGNGVYRQLNVKMMPIICVGDVSNAMSPNKCGKCESNWSSV